MAASSKIPRTYRKIIPAGRGNPRWYNHFTVGLIAVLRTMAMNKIKTTWLNR
jgi:hypothetical protein